MEISLADKSQQIDGDSSRRIKLVFVFALLSLIGIYSTAVSIGEPPVDAATAAGKQQTGPFIDPVDNIDQFQIRDSQVGHTLSATGEEKTQVRRTALH